jgi:hypothetical protein
MALVEAPIRDRRPVPAAAARIAHDRHRISDI